jgi:hypothetical protein
MAEQSERAALIAALTTEHYVLQTANNSTYSEASARSTLYVMALFVCLFMPLAGVAGQGGETPDHHKGTDQVWKLTYLKALPGQ